MNPFSDVGDFWTPLILSIKVVGVATVIVTVLGTACAKILSRASFNMKFLVESVLLIPLVLPPSVVGYALLLFLGAHGWAGRLSAILTGHTLLFTSVAAVIAATVVAFPFMYQTAKVAFESVDPDLEDAARVTGASEWAVFWWITLPLSIRTVLTGILLSSARALGEFGATLMVAGNIPGQTETAPVAIYFAIDAGNLRLATSLSIALVAIGFALLYVVQLLRSPRGER